MLPKSTLYFILPRSKKQVLVKSYQPTNSSLPIVERNIKKIVQYDTYSTSTTSYPGKRTKNCCIVHCKEVIHTMNPYVIVQFRITKSLVPNLNIL